MAVRDEAENAILNNVDLSVRPRDGINRCDTEFDGKGSVMKFDFCSPAGLAGV